MVVFVALIVLVFLLGIRTRKSDDTILDHRDTSIINGIFVLFIFLSHCTQYWPLQNELLLDELYQHVQNIHNQWVVTTFLAFSGYGVMQSFLTRGEKYLRTYPYRRLLKTLINFDIAVILYLLLAVIVGEKYTVPTILGSFIGITSVGNSNWYIFAILVLYSLSYLAAKITKSSNKQVFILFVGTAVYYAIMRVAGFDERFYSTIMCYPAGALLAVYRADCIRWIKRRKVTTLLVLLLLLLATYKLRRYDIIMNFSSIVFVGLIVWFLCFFEIQSPVFYFCGKHAFSIFILQRIPGILIANCFEVTGKLRYPVIVLDLALTILLSVIFDRLLAKIDKALIERIDRKRTTQ